MFTQEALAKYIYDYIKACNQSGVTFKKVILFGSYASNTAHKWSDIDLALVSDDFTLNPLDNIDKIAKTNIRFPDIETHTYPTYYFEKSDPFIEVIKRTGREIKL